MRALIDLVLKQRILINLLFVLFMGIGLAVYSRLPVDSWPEVSLDEAWITTYWDGAGSDEVERLVTKKIEDEIEDVAGVDRITSSSQSNLSFIDVKFNEDLDEQTLEIAFNDLRTALDRVVDLPDDAEQPILQRLTTNEVWPLFSVVVSAPDPSVSEMTLRETARELRKVLSDVDSVQRVRFNGLREREVHVLVDRLKARQLGVGLTEIVAALNRTNRPHPAGSSETTGIRRIESADGTSSFARDEVRIKFDDEFRDPQELRRAIVRNVPGAAPIRIEDVARVESGFERQVMIPRMNGHLAVVLDVAKETGGDTISLREACGVAIEEFKKIAPKGIEFEVVGDQSEIVRSRFAVLLENLFLGVIFVSIILFFALGLRNALIALIGLPFAYVCCFVFFPSLDVTINNLSLFGLVLVGGMLVDDAIVVIENIYRHIEKGGDVLEAVRRGTSEVAWPVTNACLTTVAAMCPLLLQGGVVGKFFSFIPKVVILALIFSVIQCVCVLPVHYYDFGAKLRGGANRFLHRARTSFFRWCSGIYTRVLAVVLRFRLAFLSMAAGLSVLVVGLYTQVPEDPWVSDFNVVFVTLKCDPSYSLERTDAAGKLVEKEMEQLLEGGAIKNYYSVSGFRMTSDGVFIRRPNAAFFMATLVDKRETGEDSDALIERIRTSFAKRLAAQDEHRVVAWEVFPPHDGPPMGKPVAVRIECNDYLKAKKIAEEMKGELRNMKGVRDVGDNLDVGPREYRFQVDADRAGRQGFFPQDLALALRCANDGLVAGSFKDRVLDEDVDIRVIYDPKDRSNPNELLVADVGSLAAGGDSPVASLVPVGEISSVAVERPYASLYHYNTRRTVLVTADVDNITVSGTDVNERLQKLFEHVPEQNPDVRLTFGGEFEENKKSMEQQKQSFGIAVVFIYVLLAAQFKSYRQPIVVMAVVPFAVLGVLFGLWIRNQPFTNSTMIAMMGLAGVVVNDSLMLVEFINLRRAEGMERMQAILTASRERFRPILLAASTTICNLIPLAFGLGGSSPVWTPFAVSIVFGMGVASAMTLFMVPVLYSLFERK